MTALEEIKKALEGVTPGPWELCAHLKHNDACSCGYRGVIYGPEPDGFAICQPGHEPAPEGQEGTEPPRYPRDVEIANMRYIAAVNPAAISELLSTLESLQRENERLSDDVKREAELATHMANDCNDAQARAEAAEAEVKRLRGELAFYSCDSSTCDCISGQEDANSVTCGFRARTALASTGGEHHAE